MFFKTTAVGCAILLAMALALPVQAQVKMQDLNFQNKTLEPGAGTQMAIGAVGTLAEPQTGSAALGDGVIVFKFKVSDIDPIADDSSDVTISCILIQNLGTATATDIAQVMVLDQDSNALAAPNTPQVRNTTDPTTLTGCNTMARTGNNPQVIWERFFDLSAPGSSVFVLPDDGTETFQVAVRVSHVNDLATGDLFDDSQNHTLVLRATLQLNETVGSPPNPTTFVDPATDGAPEVIWNGGINSFTQDSYVVDPLMPGQTGVVNSFTICDNDADEDQLILDRFFIRQDEIGTALSSDIVSLDLYRVEGFTRTLVASRTPDVTFERGSGSAGGLAFPGGGFTAITVPDDTCMTFELEAQVSPFAFKGHTISPRISVSAQEPFGVSISSTVEPEIRTNVPTLIGKGLLVLPDTKLIGKPGIVPVNVSGVALPGLGTLQIGPNGKLQYDPRVITVKSIRGVGPYVVDAVEVDNRRGEARFTVRIDPSFDGNGDGLPDNALLTGVQNGTVAELLVEPTGQPGDRTRLVLTFDCFELVDQNNCIPTGFPNANMPNQNPNNDISVSGGEVTLLFPGDLNFDGAPTIRDSLLLANAILACTGVSTTTTTNGTTDVITDLTPEQRSVADVAAPFAGTNVVPGCSELTSADVAEIARLAINFGTAPAPQPIGAAVTPHVASTTWTGFLTNVWHWLSGTRSRPEAASLRVGFNSVTHTVDVAVTDVPGSALGGLQGHITFDPSEMQVHALRGINGYNVLASQVDNVTGTVRFLALAPKGQGVHNGQLVRLHVTTNGDVIAPSLSVEALIDEDAAGVPYTLAQQRRFAAQALSLNKVQALSVGDGVLRFQALGTGISSVQVQIYDLAGGKLLDQQVQGNSLNFQGLSVRGQPLANGVYLYVITAHGFQGDTLRSSINKFVILR